MLQQDPTLTPDQVKARLMKTATKLPLVKTTAPDPVTGVTYSMQNDIFTVGAGYLNVPAALANTDRASGSAASPVAVFNWSNGTVSIGVSGSIIWGESAAWGTSAVWGASAGAEASDGCAGFV